MSTAEKMKTRRSILRYAPDGQSIRNQKRKRGRREGRQQQTKDPAGQGQNHILGEELAKEPLASGSDGNPHGDLAAAHHGTREQEIRQIGAGDQQHAERCSENRKYQRARLRRDHVPQLDDGRAHTWIVLWIGALELLGDDISSPLRLLQRNSGAEAGEGAEIDVPAVQNQQKIGAGPRTACSRVGNAESRRASRR